MAMGLPQSQRNVACFMKLRDRGCPMWSGSQSMMLQAACNLQVLLYVQPAYGLRGV
jgi:hypothetical protein